MYSCERSPGRSAMQQYRCIRICSLQYGARVWLYFHVRSSVECCVDITDFDAGYNHIMHSNKIEFHTDIDYNFDKWYTILNQRLYNYSNMLHVMPRVHYAVKAKYKLKRFYPGRRVIQAFLYVTNGFQSFLRVTDCRPPGWRRPSLSYFHSCRVLWSWIRLEVTKS